jgi:hypothetical protein
MTMSDLPQPPIGRNPPLYRRRVPSWKTLWIAGVVVACFAVAGGVYYVFNLNHIPIEDATGQTTSGQSK